MAKALRMLFEGAIYHVNNRGIDRRMLFWDEKDYQEFLECLATGVERFHVRVYQYCLMPNHFHLLVETPLGNLDRFMLSVQTRYGGYFNRRHGRTGFVYQGPYRAKVVEGDEYLLKLSRYLHLNPVRTRDMEGRGLREKTERLRAYRWSSYRGYVGKEKRKDWVEYGPIKALVAEQMGGRKDGYRKYVEAGLTERDKELEAALKASPLCIGTEGFVEKIKGVYWKLLEGVRRPEDAGFRRMGRWLDASGLQKRVSAVLDVEEEALKRRRGNGWIRGVMAEMLTKYGGMSQRDVAGFFGLKSGAAVCVQLKKLARQRAKDHRLDARLRKLEDECRKAMYA